MASRICLLHWSEPEGARRAQELEAAGYAVELQSRFDPDSLRSLAQSPPSAIVLDLSRKPSHGRDVALALRTRAGTRRVPLVFAGGERDAVQTVRSQLPDAVYATWEHVGSALADAIASRRDDPIVPPSALAGYSGRPLPKKLGIKPGSTVSLVEAPPSFEASVGELPPGARFRRGRPIGAGLVIWFVRSARHLDRGLRRYAQLDAPIWIVWSKRSSSMASDLSQNTVRAAGLAAGLVDYKVCAVDETWSGLLFTRRR